MSEEKILKVLSNLKNDYKLYAENVLKIRTKSGKIEPLVLNQSQLFLHDKIEDMRERTGKVRVVVLKGRQQGMSTYTEGRFYWRTTMCQGKQAFILTHESEATTNLFSMTKRYHELNTANVGGVGLKPDTSKDSGNALHFSKIDSGFKVGTAGNKAVGRGSTVQFLHGSEVAFWPNAEEHLKGLLQAVPDEDDTEVILESTANGVGGVYYDYVNDAKNGVGDYELIFIPWYWQAEYRKPVHPEFIITKEEESLKSLYGVDEEQLVWRRSKIHELKGVDAFKQEYPFTIEEAFLFSGRGAFDANWLNKAADDCFKPSFIGDMTESGFLERPDGLFSIWDKPKSGVLYAVAADIAEGLIKGDFTSVDVMDEVGLQVACWHGHIAPDKAGELIAKIGTYYNDAFVGVERNNHGLTTLTRLRDVGYSNLYAQENLENRSEGDQSVRFGWLTTAKSKPMIIDHLQAVLRDGESGLASIEHVKEMREYIIEDNGSYNARSGAKDDRVMSYAILLEMVRRMPKWKPV